MTDTSNLTPAKNKIPYLLMVSATIILIMGIVGFLFFATATTYQFYHPQFLNEISSTYQLTNLNIYVIIQTLLHSGLIISALLIIKQKIEGLYLYFSVFLVMLAVELFFDNLIILNYVISGLLMGLVIMIYRRRLS